MADGRGEGQGEHIWGPAVYGDPACRVCGYAWSTTYEEALGLIENAPTVYRELIAGREEAAMRKPDEATWSPAGYVWHLSDWFRIQGLRIFGRANDPLYRVVRLGGDQDALGEFFRYDELPPTAGLWALEWAARLFGDAARDADRGLVFQADEEWWTIHDLVVWVGHEAFHHEIDIRQALDAR